MSPEQMARRFEGFRTMNDPELEKMLMEAVRFTWAMNSTNEPAHWLSLVGPSGTGKTYLAQMIAAVFARHHDARRVDELRSGPGRRYLRSGGLLNWEKCVTAMVERRDFGFMRQACEDWFLVIDDAGAEHARFRELSASKLFTILNARVGKWTVLTANLTVPQISERLDARIASRLIRHGGVVVDNGETIDFNLRARG